MLRKLISVYIRLLYWQLDAINANTDGLAIDILSQIVDKERGN